MNINHGKIVAEFRVSARYTLLEPIGHGSYGVVVSGVDNVTGRKVAVKKVSNLFTNPQATKRALREILLMKHFSHSNVLPLLDIEVPHELHFNDLYIVTPLMETDLHQVIKSGQKLSERHIQFFMFQMVRGLKHIHDANVLHRDLKPGNILMNSDCTMKICDFGMARLAPKRVTSNSEFAMTVYVATRWYRAPEVILAKQYTKAIDVWSLGCIFAELLSGQPLFQGGHYMHQINRIIEVMGTPSPEDIAALDHPPAQEYVLSLGYKEPVPMSQIFPNVTNPQILDLLSSMLAFNPYKRATVDEILAHPFMQNPKFVQALAKDTSTPFDDSVFRFERFDLSADDYRRLFVAEIVDKFHPEARPMLEAMGPMTNPMIGEGNNVIDDDGDEMMIDDGTSKSLRTSTGTLQTGDSMDIS